MTRAVLLLALARRVLRTNGSGVDGHARGESERTVGTKVPFGGQLALEEDEQPSKGVNSSGKCSSSRFRVLPAVGSLLALVLGCTAPQPTVTLEDGCQVRIPNMVCPERDRCLAVIEFEGCGDEREGG